MFALGRPSLESVSLAHNKACLIPDSACNFMKVVAAKRDAPFGRVSRPAVLVDKDRRAAPFDRVGPVPVRQNHQVVQRVTAPQCLVAVGVGRAHHHVVIFVRGIVRPQVRRPDGFRPIGRFGDAVRAIEHPDNAVDAPRCGPVPLALVCFDPALADGAGIGFS